MISDITLPLLAGPVLVGFLTLILWTVVWKGWALWIAAKNTHKWWFVILLIVNTAGILEIIYIFSVGRPTLAKTAGMSSSAV